MKALIKSVSLPVRSCNRTNIYPYRTDLHICFGDADESFQFEDGLPMLSASIFGFDTANASIINGVFRPFLECCLEETCISPPGADAATHRYASSVLALASYRCVQPCFGRWSNWMMEIIVVLLARLVMRVIAGSRCRTLRNETTWVLPTTPTPKELLRWTCEV